MQKRNSSGVNDLMVSPIPGTIQFTQFDNAIEGEEQAVSKI